MPALTPAGVPYPLPTDPIANGAEAIHQVALALPGKMLAGSAVITPATANTNTAGAAVVFPAGFFTATPKVYVNPQTGPGGGATDTVFAWSSAGSAAGFTPNIKRSTITATTVNWLAIGA
jgi:hypothetical protein